MDALILSCGTGGGHDSAGLAIAQELTSRGHRAKTLNPYTLKSQNLAKRVNQAYISLVQKVPSAFGVAYHIGDVYRRLPGDSPVYLANRRMAPFLEQYLEEGSFDAIVCTHLFPAEILTKMKRRGVKLPATCFVATDYVCIPFTEEIDCDHYIVPAGELIDDFLHRGIPEDRIFPLGIPVDAQFDRDVDRTGLRRELGLDPERKYILLAGGSVGAGHIESTVSLLLQHYAGKGVTVIVICGNNRRLYRTMKEYNGADCMVLEYTDQMANYMKACDLFISKPGGLSSTEAAVSGTPLIHIAPIPGCENHNMNYFERHGMSIAVTSPKTQLTDACDRLLFCGEERERMRDNQRKGIPHHAASAICDLLESRQL